MSDGSTLDSPGLRTAPWLPAAVLRRPLLALTVVAALTLLGGIWNTPVFDRDEPRFSQATLEMLERGDPVVPTFNREYRFDKPPLTYWWMGLHVAVLGKGELAARLHSVEASLLAAFLIFWWGRRMFSAGAAWLAAFFWLTHLQILQHGKLALADMPMILGVIAMMWALWELLRPRREDAAPIRPYGCWYWLLWGGGIFGFLAKGPIAWAVPLLALLLTRLLLYRKPLPWRNLQATTGLPLLFLGVAAWGIPALLATNGQFAREGLGTHVVERGFESFNERLTIPFYYLLTAFVSLLPWIAFAPRAWHWLRRHRGFDAAFLLSWLIAPFLIFLFYSTQLPHYTMPGFPAFFLMLGAGWALLRSRPASRKSESDGKPEQAENLGNEEEQAYSRPTRPALFTLVCYALWGLLVLALVLAGAATLGRAPEALRPLGTALLAVAGMLGLLLYLGARTAASPHPAGGKPFQLACGAIALAGVFCGWSLFGAQLREVGLTLRLREAFAEAGVEEAMRPGSKWAIGYTEPSLVYYYGAGWRMLGSRELDAAVRQLTQESAEEGQPVVVVRKVAERDLGEMILGWVTGRGEAKALQPARLADPVNQGGKEPGATEEAALAEIRAGFPKARVVEGLNFARLNWTRVTVRWREAAAE